MEGFARRVARLRHRFGVGDAPVFPPVVLQLERLTVSQLVDFFHTCRDKYMRAKMEPGNWNT
jgi:hypothetical protein